MESYEWSLNGRICEARFLAHVPRGPPKEDYRRTSEKFCIASAFTIQLLCSLTHTACMTRRALGPYFKSRAIADAKDLIHLKLG